MNPLKIKNYKKSGPERKLQDAIVDYLIKREWYVKETHGSIFMSGVPDLFVCHYTLGWRWVEVKNPEHYSFTPAQLETFPSFQSKGIGIWIMAYCDEYEYQRLFQPPNWHTFLGKSSMVRLGTK